MASTNPPAQPTEAATNPFVCKNIWGFEDPKVTIERHRQEREEKAAAAADKAAVKAANATYNKGDYYKPLQPGENLWGPEINSIRRHNIIGGWVAKSRG